MGSKTWCGLALLCCLGCADEAPRDEVETASATQAELLLPHILSDGQMEHGGVFSPAGDALFYTVSDTEYEQFDIMVVERHGGTWSAPRKAPFSTEFSEHGLFFGPEGQRLLMASTRPRLAGESASLWRLWSWTHNGTDWGEPAWIRLQGMEGRWQSHGTMTADGVLYFHASRGGGERSFDLYRALPEEGSPESSGFGLPVPLGPPINTEGIEVTAWVAPDESFLLFAAYDRPDGYGQGDLYISHRSADGPWGTPLNLGRAVNTAYEESNPSLTPDGRYLVFSSGRPLPEPHADKQGLHLYRVRADVLEREHP